MKQNTKFLWIYIAILFSFALILIVFAGLSRNTENEQQEGLREDIATLSAKNTELTSELSRIQTELNVAMEEKGKLEAANATFEANEALLAQAITEYDGENFDVCKEIIGKIDATTLSASQTYVYNMIKKAVDEE